MRTFIFALLLALVPMLAHAEEHAPGSCYQKTITVCVPKKHKKAPTPAPVAQPAPTPDPEPQVVVKTETVVKTVPGPTKVVKVPEPCTREHVKECEDDKEPRFGIYGAAGVGVRDQYYQVNLGVQVRIPKAYLGVRLYSAIDRGFGGAGLIYVYQKPKVKIHVLDPGFLVSGGPFGYANNTDVPRQVDLTFGAGVEVRLKCDLYLLVDWHVNMADPVYLAENDHKYVLTGPNSARYLDAPHVVGNSFSSSQLTLGLLWDLPIYKQK